jgi:hypothetical protein
MVVAVLAARRTLATCGIARPVACLTVEVLAGAAGYLLGAIVFAPGTSRELVARVVDAVRVGD